MKIIASLFFISLLFFACQTEKIIVNDYPDPILPGDSAITFAAGKVSTINHEHSRMEFNRDGTELYWEVIPVDTNYVSASGNPFVIENQNIWYVRKTPNGWTLPEILPATKNMRAGRPILSLDEYALSFQTDDLTADPEVRPRPSISMSLTRKGNSWINPDTTDLIVPKVEGKTTMLFCYADNGNIYYDLGGPTETGDWTWQIYFMKYKNGKYIEPVLMENGINDEEINWCPWIAPDESYLIFSSHRAGSIGSGDLYISFNENGKWSQPVNMGPKVNTPSQERFPSVSPDGKYLFFARHVKETFSDIFWISSEVIDGLRATKL